MTIARCSLLVVAAAGLAAPALAHGDHSPTTVPVITFEAPPLSEQELDLINDALSIERVYRTDRRRLVTFRMQVVREGDQDRRATVDRLGRELDAWRKASLEHIWIQLSFAGRRELNERLLAACEPAADSQGNPVAFKGHVAIPHAQMDRELDHLRRLMNRRAATLEEMLPEPTEPPDSAFVSRTGSSLTIAMPGTDATSKRRTTHRTCTITGSR